MRGKNQLINGHRSNTDVKKDTKTVAATNPDVQNLCRNM